MKREVCFLIGANDEVLWSDASSSALALPDSRERWEAIWSRREALVEIAHSHPLGPEAFSAEDISTMKALDDALGRRVRFSLVTPAQYLVRGEGDVATPAVEPFWVEELRQHSGMTSTWAQTTGRLEEKLAVWEGAGPVNEARLRPLVEACRAELQRQGRVELVFVCTHNSRRSVISEVLAHAAARWAGLRSVRTFSAGTDVTAVNPRTIAALARAGCRVEVGNGENPRCRVWSTSGGPVISTWSKRLGDEALPKSGFVAVMTCGEADEACPVVMGASQRVSLPFVDPKKADGTDQESETYDARVAEIGRELVWVFREMKKGGAL